MQGIDYLTAYRPQAEYNTPGTDYYHFRIQTHSCSRRQTLHGTTRLLQPDPGTVPNCHCPRHTLHSTDRPIQPSTSDAHPDQSDRPTQMTANSDIAQQGLRQAQGFLQPPLITVRQLLKTDAHRNDSPAHAEQQLTSRTDHGHNQRKTPHCPTAKQILLTVR